jgi:glycosyltransferase involved in cell wall biosynthesis
VLEALRREINPRWDAIAVYSLRRLLRRLDADIVHTHSSKAGIVGRFAAAPLGARTVHTIHGWGHTPRDSQLRRATFIALERAAAKRCDALVAVSADSRDEGLAHNIGRPHLYRVIPGVVELEPLESDFGRARARARAELELDPDADVVGWVGRFVDQKDPETLSLVLVELLRRRPSIRAVLIGDGPRKVQVERSLRAAGALDRTRFTGVVPGARALMPAFDVLLHPSRWEGQPIVIQEALAERLPVVCTRVSGIGELIREGETGYVVAPRDHTAMARAAATVLDTPALRAPLGDHIIDHLGATHGRTIVLQRHRELYADLLEGVD